LHKAKSQASLENTTIGKKYYMRKLRIDEINIIKALLCSTGSNDYGEILKNLDELTVEELNDEGMGSLQFISKEKRKLCKTIAEAEFNDEDGVLVFLSLGIDSQGELFELDIWKADFSALTKLPFVEAITIKKSD
jgi:hypothetical protein